MSAGEVMFCAHDSRLVVLSILISMLAAFAARELFGRINEAQGRVWLAWLAGTAVVWLLIALALPLRRLVGFVASGIDASLIPVIAYLVGLFTWVLSR